jgi:hypothetical protein
MGRYCRLLIFSRALNLCVSLPFFFVAVAIMLSLGNQTSAQITVILQVGGRRSKTKREKKRNNNRSIKLNLTKRNI